MYDLFQEIASVLKQDVNDLRINEKNQFLVAKTSLEKVQLPKWEEVYDILSRFPSRDNVKFRLCDVTGENIVINNHGQLKEVEYVDFLDSFADNDEFDVEIQIDKGIEDGKISVYNLQSFNEFLLLDDLWHTINVIKEDIKDRDYLIFELMDSELVLATRSIVFRPYNKYGIEINAFERKSRMTECRKNCLIYGSDEMFPLPDDFHFVINGMENPFIEKFKKIESLLSLCYISDNVQLNKQNVQCYINGKQIRCYDICIEQITYNSILFDIYNWIYSEGNIVDKVTLARNLLSIHCQYIQLDAIDKKTYNSIRANFALYQKQNVEKYIEIKSILSEFLTNIIGQSKEIVLDVIGELGKNIMACFTFVLTVFITSIMSEKGLEGIFTKEVTYFSYIIILGSIGYLFLTNKIVDYKIKKMKESYETLKDNNDFFKDTKEYEEIFKDEKLVDVIKEIRKYKFPILIIWGAFILGIWIVVEILSDYGVLKKCCEFFYDILLEIGCYLIKLLNDLYNTFSM